MCVEFYLLTKVAGAKKSLLWRLIIASTWMLVCGYIGEAMSDGSTGHSVQWGVLSTLGYLYILYTVWLGEVAKLADASNSDVVKKGGKIVLITYHSIEDRLVKRFIQNGCFESEPVKDDFGKLNLPFKKSFKFKVPSIQEVKLNNRARSAKLRSAIRL